MADKRVNELKHLLLTIMKDLDHIADNIVETQESNMAAFAYDHLDWVVNCELDKIWKDGYETGVLDEHMGIAD